MAAAPLALIECSRLHKLKRLSSGSQALTFATHVAWRGLSADACARSDRHSDPDREHPPRHRTDPQLAVTALGQYLFEYVFC